VHAPQVLQPPLGTVLVAAKSFYHGVGGGVASFKRALLRDRLFEVSHVFATSCDAFAVTARAAGDGSDAQRAGEDQSTEAQHPVVASKPTPVTAPVAAGGGNVREVLELAFPQAILPYFL
jgi:hypothetical protein